MKTPTPPDMSADISPITAFKMLAASLSDTQWMALTSESGLGLTDLNDATQQLLFHALFRQGQLWVASQDPALSDLPDDQRTDRRNISDQIGNVRVRLGQTAKIYPHDHKGQTIFFSAKPSGAAQRLQTWSPQAAPPAAQHNVVLRAVIPNTSRHGDLNLENAAFKTAVPLTGLITVDDLVSRVATATHREIYADPHYAHRTLTLIGPATTAPAADLLEALALTVAGTYRQVGPAFVLTDDLAGVGTRRQKIRDWEEAANNSQDSLRNQAGAALLKRRVSAARTLPTFGDPVALTPNQIASLPKDAGIPELPDEQRDYPFAKLTIAQQEWVRAIAAAFDEKRISGTLPDYLAEDNLQAVDANGPVDIRPYMKVQLLVPTINGPVDTSLQYAIGLLFWPGDAAMMENLAAAPKPSAPALLPPAPPLLPLLHSRSRRAVFGYPRTVAGVDSLITAMQKIGLNELWLDVFSQGAAHVSGSPLSAKALSPEAPDILAEALKQTKSTSISVYADLSLLLWGASPPEAACGLSIQGETSRELDIHTHDRAQEPDFDDSGKPIAFVPAPVIVSPAAIGVRDDLSALIRALSTRPGLAGFVWEDAEPGDSLGYTPEMRLWFLRTVHADPIDITPDISGKADVSLPAFDDPAADKTLPPLWVKAQTQANAALLIWLRQALSSAGPLPILMEQSVGQINWLASWDDPRQLPPPLRSLSADGSTSSPQIAAEARKQGRAVLLREPIKDASDTEALARTLQADLKNAPWDGFVLDFMEIEATGGDHPLAALVQAAAK